MYWTTYRRFKYLVLYTVSVLSTRKTICSETEIKLTHTRIRFLCFGNKFAFAVVYNSSQQVKQNGNKHFWFTAFHTHTHTHNHFSSSAAAVLIPQRLIQQNTTLLFFIIILLLFFFTYSQPGYTAFTSPCIVVYIRHVANTVIVCLCIEFVFAFSSAPRAEVCTRCMGFGRRTTGVDPFLNSYPPQRVSSPLTRGVEYTCVYIYSTHTFYIVCRY